MAQVLLNILIYKFRSLVTYIIYIELLINIVHAFVPYRYGDFKDMFLIMKAFFVYFNHACNTKQHFICTLLMVVATNFIIQPLVYKSEDYSKIFFFKQI